MFPLSAVFGHGIRVFSIFGEFGQLRLPISEGVLHSYQNFLPYVNRFRESLIPESVDVDVDGNRNWLESHEKISDPSFSFEVFVPASSPAQLYPLMEMLWLWPSEMAGLKSPMWTSRSRLDSRFRLANPQCGF